MNIVVTTPTGNIGSVVVQTLLDAGEKPVLIARDASKLKSAIERGATVVEGSHADVRTMIEATKEAEALFVLVPADYGIDDIGAYYRSFAEVAAEAAQVNGIKSVVLLSSAGADKESGNGPVAGLHAAEEILGRAGIPNLTLLRPGYFMENTLAQIPNIVSAGALFTTFAPGVTFPMIATRDIGRRAAEILMARENAGHRVIELHGGSLTSYDEVAEVLTNVLERPVAHVTVTDEQFIGGLTEAGLGPVMASALAELSAAMSTGFVGHLEPRSEANTMPTDFATFAREVLRPIYLAASTA